MSFGLDEKVWITFEKKWWPAVVVDPNTVPADVEAERKGEDTCVQFFGEGSYYWLNQKYPSNIVGFDEGINKKYHQAQKSKSFQHAVKCAMEGTVIAAPEPTKKRQREQQYVEEDEDEEDDQYDGNYDEMQYDDEDDEDTKPIKPVKKAAPPKKAAPKKADAPPAKAPKPAATSSPSPVPKETKRTDNSAATNKPKPPAVKTPPPSKPRTNIVGEEDEEEVTFDGDEEAAAKSKKSAPATPVKKKETTTKTPTKAQQQKRKAAEETSPKKKEKESTTKAELEELAGKLEKALANNNTAVMQQVVDRLNSVIITFELLQGTGIGKAVNHGRKSSDKDVAESCRRLVEEWKELVKNTSASAKTATKTTTTSSNNNATPNRMPTEKKLEATPESKKPVTSTTTTTSADNSNGGSTSTAKPENNQPAQQQEQQPTSPKTPTTPTAASTTTTAKKPQVKPVTIPSTLKLVKQDVRDYCIKAFFTTFAEVDDDTQADIDKKCRVAENIEHELFKFHGQQVEKKYKEAFRSLNLNLKRNGKLRVDLLEDRVTPERFVQMKPEDMMTDEQRAEMEATKKRLADAARSDWARAQRRQNASTSQFQCRRCKSRNCDYYQMQTRSADEPMTTFVTCLNCDNRWKC